MYVKCSGYGLAVLSHPNIAYKAPIDGTPFEFRFQTYRAFNIVDTISCFAVKTAWFYL